MNCDRKILKTKVVNLHCLEATFCKQSGCVVYSYLCCLEIVRYDMCCLRVSMLRSVLFANKCALTCAVRGCAIFRKKRSRFVI